MDFARRHIDEKIIRMRIDVGDVGDARLRDVLKSRKNVIDYLYDFGDSWEHRITVTNIRPAESGVSYPRYIAGEWNAPPEDCGGIPGFYAMLEAVADPNHPNHAEAKEWLDEYDPRLRCLKRAADQKSTGLLPQRTHCYGCRPVDMATR
jgi:hypothetical protein